MEGRREDCEQNPAAWCLLRPSPSCDLARLLAGAPMILICNQRTLRKKHQVCVRSSGQKCWEHKRGHILESLEASVSGSCPGEEGEPRRLQDKELWDQSLLSHCRNRLVKEDGLGLGELEPQRQHKRGGCTAALPRMVCWGRGTWQGSVWAAQVRHSCRLEWGEPGSWASSATDQLCDLSPQTSLTLFFIFRESDVYLKRSL